MLLGASWRNVQENKTLSPQKKLEAFAQDTGWQEVFGSNLSENRRMKVIEAAAKEKELEGAKVTGDIGNIIKNNVKTKEAQLKKKAAEVKEEDFLRPEPFIDVTEVKHGPSKLTSIDVLMQNLSSQKAPGETIFHGNRIVNKYIQYIWNQVGLAFDKADSLKERTGEEKLRSFAEDNLWNENIGRSGSLLKFTPEQKAFFIEEAARYFGTDVPPDMK